MNIGIYNPYLDTLGGHERYCLDIAVCLSGAGHTVDVFWDDPAILNKAKKRFNLDTRNIQTTRNIFLSTTVTEKLMASRAYDVLLFVSDGSIPLLLSKKTILSFQFPVPWVKGKTFINRIKLKKISDVICNSLFVKEHIDKTFGVTSQVLAPGIDTVAIKPGKKEKIILSVGRFTQGMNAKKQEQMIESFEKLCDDGIKDWKLILAGGMLPVDQDFVTALKRHTKTYPIEILTNISFDTLQSLYAHASVYWHAAGFGEDLKSHPERAEHFGISTAEAMSAGVVPVVFAGGGQKDMIEEGKNGFLWTEERQLIHYSKELIRNADKRVRMGQAAEKRAQIYSRERFYKQIHALFSRL